MGPIDIVKQEENLDAADYWREWEGRPTKEEDNLDAADCRQQEEDRRAQERWEEAQEAHKEWEAMVRWFQDEE